MPGIQAIVGCQAHRTQPGQPSPEPATRTIIALIGRDFVTRTIKAPEIIESWLCRRGCANLLIKGKLTPARIKKANDQTMSQGPTHATTNKKSD
jgi:hypothetical protein